MADPFADNPEESDALATAARRIADLLADRIAPALERIASALEGRPGAVERPPDSIADLRKAIQDGEFALAETLLDALDDSDPESAEAARLREQLGEAKRVRANDHRARLDASRSVNDPIAALDHRDALASLLDFQEMAGLDRDLVKWLMMLLMKRMRAGSVREDVAALALRASASFGHLPEGASLRAALPTLRRSAGLCPRCASPYVGEEDACEKCLAIVPKIADLPLSPAPAT